MSREQEPASMHLRMSPQLRESLRAAASEAGCSLNAFAVQVLSAAAGDAARFRSVDDSNVRQEAARPPQKWRSRLARNDFIRVKGRETGWVGLTALVHRLDTEDPGYFLEWYNARRTGDTVREPRFSDTVT